MRTVIYGAACSLDGFITDADGGLGWLHFSADAQRVMEASLAGVDAFLMGRRTWEVAMASGHGGGDGGGKYATYLFSRTLREPPGPGVTLVREDAGGFVRALKAQPGGGICVMGGGELAQALFAAGVIDEVGLNIHPILLGRGTPLFRDAGRIPLELVESRVLHGGCVLATYRVARRAARRARRDRGP